MIVVTGASRGLGAHIRQTLIGQGHAVVGLARAGDPDRDILACDVGDPEAVKAAAKAIKARGTPISAVICAAGIASMNLAVMTPARTVRQVIETNLLGTIYINQQFAPLMLRQKAGSIINFSTIAVALALKGEAVYAASKAGVEGFTRSFAREMADFNITVNCIAPGPIRTDLLRGITEDQIGEITARQIFTDVHTPDDVADTVRLLLSPRARRVTGQVLHVGGV